MLKDKNQLCSYCKEREGKYYFKTAEKWCCESTYHKCPAIRKKTSISVKNRHPEHQKLKQDLKEGKLKCYICGETANYLVHINHPCCSNGSRKCPGYSKYLSDKHNKYYETNNNYYKGKKRPNHSKALLRKNKFGSLGGYNFWHIKARERHYTGVCCICGKTKEEEIKDIGRDLHMHCVNTNFTDLSESNWMVVDNACHRYLHSKKFIKEHKKYLNRK